MLGNNGRWPVKKNIWRRSACSISITSGKGGVGKTSIAVKMGEILAAWNHRVLLFDCDYNLSNTAVKLGIPLSDNFSALLKGEKAFDECLFRKGNLHLLSGCNGNLDLFDSYFKIDKFIMDLLISCEKDYDFILLDCPAGISKEALSLNSYTDFRFFVVTPEKSSITDSYSLIKVLHNRYGVNENHLIVNKVSSLGQYEKIVTIMGKTIENFLGCHLLRLGGISKGDVDVFDRFSLSGKKGKIHENIVKILNHFTEELNKSVNSGEIEQKFHARDRNFQFAQNTKKGV